MQGSARVVVVGGGVVGCSVLYHLAKKGWSDVVLCERTELTAGSTWHAAGNVITYTLDETVSRLNQYGADLYAQLEDDTGVPSGYHQCGNLRLATHPDRMDEFKRYMGLARQTGVEAHLVSPDEIRDLWPFMNIEGVLGGLYNPGDGHIAPADLTQSFAAGARKYGAKIHRSTEVTGFTETPTGWIVHTSRGDIACEHVVSCTGNYTKQTLGLLGLPAHAVSLRHQFIVTEPIPELIERRKAGLPEMPVMRDPEQVFYCRQEGDGLVMGAYEGRGETCFVDGVPSSFGMELFPDQLDAMLPYLETAIERIPLLETAGVQSVVNGPQPYTPDDLPYTGPAFGKRNFWLGEGNPFGVTLSGGIGWQLAEWIVEGAPTIDMRPCDSRRFGEYATRTWSARKTEEAYERTYLLPKPGEELPAARILKVSPVHDTLAARGAVFGAVYGWERPNWFAAEGACQEEEYSFYRPSFFEQVGAEVRAVRNGLAVCDISHGAKFRVSGAGADGFVNRLIAGDLPSVGARGIGYVLTSRDGFDAIFDIARLNEDDLILQSDPGCEVIDLDLLQQSAPPDLRIENLTGREGALLLSGPGAGDLLARLSTADIGDKSPEPMDEAACPPGTVKPMICGYAPIRLHRTDPFGVTGYELHAKAEVLRHVLLQLLENSSARLIGARALEVLRLEQGMPARGTELTPMRTLVEAGLEAGESDRLLVRLELLDEAPTDPLGHESVETSDGLIVGHTTSGAHGHTAGRGLAFAIVDRAALDEGAELSIRILDIAYSARVCAVPAALSQ
ncbi:dimethylglycine dehydrogenase [Roseovarius litoreus]|uniref:Dimethylglycine dehydrogenase n=1 Tax=Roseovarius litoreus TaxID=1155722 RepID=A0A1M7LLF4_9RHOB|nr:FAD-dependent oxidoreductase [Roseovarius litoreus]SHM79015.1 dimethylglycine dehydrogenase [Roseovarius litoreus]